MIEIKPTISTGCSGKVSAFELRKLIDKALATDARNGLLIGASDHDDAAVMDLSTQDDGVFTVDFMHSPLRDPYLFGRLAAAHALNDIYAMGAVPRFGLVILGGPVSPSGTMLDEIMCGVREIASEDGLLICGGHTLSTQDPICGLAVLGRSATAHTWRNGGSRVGDWVFLSKPIGVGLMLMEQNALEDVGAPMDPRLFRSCAAAAATLRNYEVTSATDVSGFGLRYQLGLMATKSNVCIDVLADHIPIYLEAREAFERGARLGSVCENGDYFGPRITVADEIGPMMNYFLDEPQTNGPLLFTLPDEDARRLNLENPDAGFIHIGCINCASSTGLVRIS